MSYVDEALASPVLESTIAGILTIIGAFVADGLRRNRRDLREIKGHSEETREQVKNSHGTNLRHDLDVVIAGVNKINDAIERQGDVLVMMRQDISWERRERIDLAERVGRMEGNDIG